MENHAKHQYVQDCPICNEVESIGEIKLPHSNELERAVLGELIVKRTGHQLSLMMFRQMITK